MAGPGPATSATWLTEFPNYDRARALDEVDAAITPQEFARRFLHTHRPCVIRGGAGSWPAVGKWDIDYLRDRLGDEQLGLRSAGVLYEPLVEYSLQRLAPSNKMSFAQFLDELESAKRDRVQAYSEYLDQMSAIRGDIGEHRVFDVATAPARSYDHRFFLSRAGYTDWHVHFADDTLTTQLVGDKEMLLLPPDTPTFKAMMPMARRGVWKTPARCRPATFTELVPYRVLLRPGDVIYLPMNWWHAAEAQGQGLNATFAQVFATPVRWFADLRLANVRFSLVISLGESVLRAVRTRRLRPILGWSKRLVLTVACFPVALWHNPRGVHRGDATTPD